MRKPLGLVQKYLEYWPGKERLGVYRFLPIFFFLGAALEFSMINWRVGDTNFYHTFKKRKALEILQERALASSNQSSP